ncbi:unnamed protein product [Urochloa humidicola]
MTSELPTVAAQRASHIDVAQSPRRRDPRLEAVGPNGGAAGARGRPRELPDGRPHELRDVGRPWPARGASATELRRCDGEVVATVEHAAGRPRGAAPPPVEPAAGSLVLLCGQIRRRAAERRMRRSCDARRCEGEPSSRR